MYHEGLVFALIVPIDKKPAVIVPKLFVVELPTYNAEAKLEVFVPIRTGPVIDADPVAVTVFAVIEPAKSYAKG